MCGGGLRVIAGPACEQRGRIDQRDITALDLCDGDGSLSRVFGQRVEADVGHSLEGKGLGDFVAPDDIRIRGTRVGIETVLSDAIHRARTPEQIVVSYPSLSLEQVYATLTYYLHHKARIDRYLTAWVEWGQHARVEQAADPVVRERLARMRRLRESRQQAEPAAQLSESA